MNESRDGRRGPGVDLRRLVAQLAQPATRRARRGRGEEMEAADRASMADFDCPSFNGDVERESGVPAGAQRLRDRLVAADAFLISSPEYNASMPGRLKNAIDWVSRIRPQPFNGRQGMLVSASPSMAGGESGLVVAASAAGASRGAGLPRHVLAGPGARGFRRGRQDRHAGAAAALRADDRMLPRAGGGGHALPAAEEAVGGVTGRAPQRGDGSGGGHHSSERGRTISSMGPFATLRVDSDPPDVLRRLHWARSRDGCGLGRGDVRRKAGQSGEYLVEVREPERLLRIGKSR